MCYKEKCLETPQTKSHLSHSQAIQREEAMFLYTSMDHHTKAFFLWHGKNKFKHQTFNILTIQVLDTITQPLLKLCFCTIIVKCKEYYPDFQRHFTLKWLKYNKINRCKSIYPFSFKTGNLHQIVFLSARGTALLKSKHAIVPLILQPTDFIGLKVQRKN